MILPVETCDRRVADGSVFDLRALARMGGPAMPSVFDRNRTLEQRRQAVANLYDFLVRGGVADSTRMPSEVIDRGHKRTLRRYTPAGGEGEGCPVLLVPPLAAEAACFDLRRGCSLVEHLVTARR